ncbi:MAG TPA: hypothetical protein VHT29_05465 [Solirubrobacteraceae bacterium]|nr:hypothetical protein [Solirubrobacteraceae bacterium]
MSKVIAGALSPELDARYPNRTHFIDAENPDQAVLTSRALFAGDPAAIIYPDGREVLLTPEPAHGVAGMLLLAVLWMKLKERSTGNLVQLPPRTRIEARDAAGLRPAA